MDSITLYPRCARAVRDLVLSDTRGFGLTDLLLEEEWHRVIELRLGATVIAAIASGAAAGLRHQAIRSLDPRAADPTSPGMTASEEDYILARAWLMTALRGHTDDELIQNVRGKLRDRHWTTRPERITTLSLALLSIAIHTRLDHVRMVDDPFAIPSRGRRR
ncbi:hypothetical protein [Microbacterium sp. Leaf320]|uniref:hypothetical protein n=1 Tax=Microbacterium sp. Leaf320 TaxID=1736334 RepID=UPI0006F798EB|nr:hypothetical protein [Microbacterium sp. Leaf320]KQQ65330.1 hypothetical protein ASF63_15425 [Microbacterium sp. Leaf320]